MFTAVLLFNVRTPCNPCAECLDILVLCNSSPLHTQRGRPIDKINHIDCMVASEDSNQRRSRLKRINLFCECVNAAESLHALQLTCVSGHTRMIPSVCTEHLTAARDHVMNAHGGKESAVLSASVLIFYRSERTSETSPYQIQ